MSCYKKHRAGEADPTYTADFTIGGKRYYVATGTTRKAEAERIEAQVKAELKAGRIPKLLEHLRQRDQVTTTIGQLCEHYESLQIEVSTTTRRGYTNALKNVIRRCHPVGTDIDALRVSVLTPDLIRKYFQTIGATLANVDQAQARSTKHSANSILTSALAIFTPQAYAALRDAGIELPDAEALRQAAKESHFRRVPPKEYTAPADTVIEAVLQGWPKIQNRNEFIAIGLCLAFGLRKSEAAQVKGSWFTTIEGRPTLDSAADVKNSSGHLRVIALDPYYTTLKTRMETQGWIVGPDDYLLDGTDTERTSETFNRISAWLRGLGWQMQKTNHALRDYAGSQVAMKYGIYDAMAWLRHAAVTTTQTHYNTFVTTHRLIEKDKIPATWAKAESKPFVPQILIA